MQSIIDIGILDTLKNSCNADDIAACVYRDDASLGFYHANKHMDIKDITSVQHAAILTAFNTRMPLIINDVTNSFLYNKHIDNPFKFKVENIALVPLYKDTCGTCMLGCLMMYQQPGSKKIFYKKDLESIEKQVGILALKSDQEEDLATKSLVCIEEKSPEVLEYKLNAAYQFFSSVVHDIRTPIGAVMGFLELMEKDVNDVTLKEYIYAAHRSSEMISALINDVLDFTKIESGKLELDKHYFSPMEEFENIAMMFYHTAKKNKIDFTIYYDVDIPYIILSDPYRIKQILNNFISNALKFTPENGTVNLSFLYDKTNDTLRIDVTDSGIGISEDAIEQIFKPFQQASKMTSGKYGGTGLGLTISKQLADMLDAELEVKSKVGEGSTFSLILPCHTIAGTPASLNREKLELVSHASIYCMKDDKTDIEYLKHVKQYFDKLKIDLKIIAVDDLDMIEENGILLCIEKNYESSYFEHCYQEFASRLVIIESSMFMESKQAFGEAVLLHRPLFPHKLFDAIAGLLKETGTIQNVNKQTDTTEKKVLNVLIADDNIINRKLMQEVLKKYHTVPLSAADGNEAVEIFNENPIDLIFIDEQMPGMDGSEAIRLIRRTEKGKDIPIYSLTGVSEEGAVNKIKKSGATDILLKPIKNEVLQEIILKYNQ